MKIKLFTHTDLDGVGCAIVAKLAFPEVDIEYCDYDNVNEKITTYINTEDYKNYKTTFITDISVNEQVAKIINVIPEEYLKEFVLLDHHKTALWLNKYPWTYVEENYSDTMKNSGIHMFYFNILDFGYVELYSDTYNTLINASNFVEAVRRYDTWEWKDKYNDTIAKMLNDLLHLKGRENFINDVVAQLQINGEFKFTKMDEFLLKQNQEKIDKYIESKDKTIIVKELAGKAGVVFAEQYHSELGNRLAELHPELDFIVIINPSQSVSYRTVKDIDLSVIAKIYGGGGHPKSSGSPLSTEIRENIIDLIFA